MNNLLKKRNRSGIIPLLKGSGIIVYDNDGIS